METIEHRHWQTHTRSFAPHSGFSQKPGRFILRVELSQAVDNDPRISWLQNIYSPENQIKSDIGHRKWISMLTRSKTAWRLRNETSENDRSVVQKSHTLTEIMGRPGNLRNLKLNVWISVMVCISEYCPVSIANTVPTWRWGMQSRRFPGQAWQI